MARPVVWSEPASAEFLAAIEHLVQEVQSLQAARRLFDEVQAAAQSLREMPERGRVVPELKIGNRRELFVLGYRLIYRVESDQVIILRVIHGRRDFKGAWRGGR